MVGTQCGRCRARVFILSRYVISSIVGSGHNESARQQQLVRTAESQKRFKKPGPLDQPRVAMADISASQRINTQMPNLSLAFGATAVPGISASLQSTNILYDAPGLATSLSSSQRVNGPPAFSGALGPIAHAVHTTDGYNQAKLAVTPVNLLGGAAVEELFSVQFQVRIGGSMRKTYPLDNGYGTIPVSIYASEAMTGVLLFLDTRNLTFCRCYHNGSQPHQPRLAAEGRSCTFPVLAQLICDTNANVLLGMTLMFDLAGIKCLKQTR
jgi:hypothetical protein